MTLTIAPAEDIIPSHNIVVLLIDDQRIIGEAVKRMLQAETDIEFHYTCDPAEALTLANRLQPTVILQDLVMPDIDGLTLVKAFRANTATANVPLIVLSSKEEPKTKAEAFALGANDYLVKLPDPVELSARIRYHSGAYIALLQRNEAFAALERSQQMLAEELSEAADYVRSLLPEPLTGPGLKTAWLFKPCSSLGGDAFGYFDIDHDHFAIFLLDVCNHGVGSALLSVSAMNALMGRTLVDVDFREPAKVLTSLNNVFLMEKHNNLYFTMWYGVLNKSSRVLRYSSGGHPPAVLLADGGTTLLRCRAMPVGTMADNVFEEGSVVVPPAARLYVFSDGIYEVHDDQGEELAFEAFVAILAQPEKAVGKKVDELLAQMCAIQGHADFSDDVSMLELRLA
ncbi:MAG: SpoIIE family protein phosphatase [Methylococcaceae bacterium]|jgi:sigma-B regulation protein RsbU (phosphoserine phosphatase)